jgi:DNA-binding response OmpR family regulator
MFSNTEPVAVTEAAPRKVILVVEDDEANAEVLRQALVQESGYLVYVAPDARAAWQWISQNQPDLFILDYRLPGLTGMELYECLHVHPRFKQTPALILTACLEHYHEAIASHKLLALAKPFDVDELLSLIAKVFDHSLASPLNN